MPPLKIFISHSHDEEWIARMIEAKLKKLRVEAYCYESNALGTSITDEIRARLHGCDEFLILLTPTSIRSHWVLYELSIAHDLGKAIRPICMYVTEQDIPPFVRHLVRYSMSDIHVYYDDVRNQMLKRFRKEVAETIAPAGSPPVPSVAENPAVVRDHMQKLVREEVASAESPEPEPPKTPKKRRGVRKPPRRK